MKKKQAGSALYKVFIYVALISLAISIVIPIAWVFMASVKRNSEFLGGDVNPFDLPKQFYYQNFIVAFEQARMGEFFLNTVIVTVLALILLLILALPAAYVLSRFKFKTLPKEFEEAAYIDGCSYFKTMLKIMVPMAKPSIITVILFNFLSFWNEYIIAYTLMDGNDTLAMGLKNLMAVQKAATNYGIMYAGLVIVMLPTLVLYIMVQKQLTEGMTAGGLKG